MAWKTFVSFTRPAFLRGIGPDQINNTLVTAVSTLTDTSMLKSEEHNHQERFAENMQPLLHTVG